MANFTYILESEGGRETEFRITFLDAENVLNLEISLKRAAIRTWKPIAAEIAYELSGFDLAQSEAEDFFAGIDREDERALWAADNARIARGIARH